MGFLGMVTSVLFMTDKVKPKSSPIVSPTL